MGMWELRMNRTQMTLIRLFYADLIECRLLDDWVGIFGGCKVLAF